MHTYFKILIDNNNHVGIAVLGDFNVRMGKKFIFFLRWWVGGGGSWMVHAVLLNDVCDIFESKGSRFTKMS